jgi:3-deoxy-manno-octulosonate cytidylyltransferase (CMP-KDO synthetase)
MRPWLIIVPARLQSQRLPRKPLADLGGRPLIVRVVENLGPLAAEGHEIVVATDSEEVLRACEDHGIIAELTRESHPSGTDRCQEVASRHSHPFILNVQGDEPFVDIRELKKLMLAMEVAPKADIGTMAHRSLSLADFRDPNVVKVVTSPSGHALYFSRAPIPWGGDRSRSLTGTLDDHATEPADFLHHIGVYAYRRDALRRFCELPPSPHETREKLEQLRALECGMTILVELSSKPGRGIDTPQDLEAARAKIGR